MLFEFLKEFHQQKEQQEYKESVKSFTPQDLVESQPIQPTFSQNKASQPCQICKTNDFKYKCPKCSLNYCSLACYKSHNKDCTEEFYQKSIEQNMKSQKVRDPSAIKKMEEILLKQHQDDSDFIDKNTGGIPESRLKELISEIESGTLNLESLSLEEQTSFAKFIKAIEPSSNLVKEWVPWWESKSDLKPSNIDIVEINNESKEQEEYTNENLNTFIEQCQDTDQQQTENPEQYQEEENDENDKKDYEDLEVIDLTTGEKESSEEIKAQKLKYAIILRRYQSIPSISKLLKKKQPSPYLKYHILSSMLSIIYFERLYNGDILDNYEYLLNKVLEQLLSTENQQLISDVESAYSQFLRAVIDHENPISLLKQYEPIVLEDIAKISQSKVDIIELFLRYYDLLVYGYDLMKNEYEKGEGTSETLKKQKQLLQKISSSKQKIIFYLGYIKSNFDPDFKELKDEIKGFEEVYIKERIWEKKAYEAIKKID